MIGHALIGSGQLIRLALRRDRFLLLVWIIAIVGITASSATALQEVYGSAESRQLLAVTANANPAFLAMLGPLHDAQSLGALLAWRWGVFAALFVSIMSLLLVTRHTRAEEESGRLELIGSTVVGRHAALAAAVIVSVGANLVIGAGIVGVLVGKDMDLTGALAFATAVVASGVVFTGISAVTAQLSENARTTNSIAGAVLGGAYLLRAAGDAAGESGPTWLTWLSPIGWTEQVRAFAGDRFWVLLVPLVVTVVTVAVAAWIVTRRDVGLGLVPTRLGPASASGLRTPFALAWRLQRGSLIGWAIGMFVLGAVYGAVAQGVGDMLSENAMLAKIVSQIGGGGSIVDVFLGTIVQVIGLIGSVYLVQAVLRLRAEETSLRAEPLLATPVSRPSWVGSHAVFAFAGGAVVYLAAGLGLGLVHGLRSGDLGGVLPRMLGATLSQLPAAWVVAGVALLLFGLVPQLSGVSWGVLATCLLITLLGPTLQLSQWVLDVSPFAHLPKLPGADVAAEPFLWLTGVAVLLLAAGFAGFRRRDLST